MARSQAERVPGVHVFSSREGAETIPRGGIVFFPVQPELANKPGMARKAGKAASEGGQAFEIERAFRLRALDVLEAKAAPRAGSPLRPIGVARHLVMR